MRVAAASGLRRGPRGIVTASHTTRTVSPQILFAFAIRTTSTQGAPKFMENFENLSNRVYNKVFGLWNTPMTREEQVKQHIPEVIEEGLAKKLELEATPRDHAVVLGDRLIRVIADQGTVSDVRRILDRFLLSVKVRGDILPEKSLQYLLHPGVVSPGEIPNTLVADFVSNLSKFVRALEDSNQRASSSSSSAGGSSTAQQQQQQDVDTEKDNYFVKLLCAMAMSNTHEKQFHNALECCSLACANARDANQRAGVLALEAGVLNHLGRYEDGATAARKAIAESNKTNSQAFLQLATSLRRLGRDLEAIALLEEGMESIPDSRRDALAAIHTTLKEKVALAITASSTKEKVLEAAKSLHQLSEGGPPPPPHGAALGVMKKGMESFKAATS